MMDNAMDSNNDVLIEHSHSCPLASEKLFDNDVVTQSSKDQKAVEENVLTLYSFINSNPLINRISSLRLNREKHISYLKKGLRTLPACVCSLDASRPWLCYWILHALELLNVKIVGEEASRICHFLCLCQNEDGGFGGGPGQFSHLATSYASVCALTIIGTTEAFEVINRQTLSKFLNKMHTKTGGFVMHEGGEMDIRGVYCAITVAQITNIYTQTMFENTTQWLLSCQTYEGGFSGSPGLEAHGGYTFCGLAALTMLGAQNLCDTDTLLKWATKRQMRLEGGFQGRTNKLVDGCYSFWMGGIFPIIHSIFAVQGDSSLNFRWMFHTEALQEYLLVCCQHPRGGMIDKPGKLPDFYHTCYTLSGLSVAQHFTFGNVHKRLVVGHPSNELVPTHSLYNVCVDSACSASQYFNRLQVPCVD